MALEKLSKDEQSVVVGCLQAVVNGPFFEDWEYHTMFGLHRHEMADILARWQILAESEENVFVGINNSMNNLLTWCGWQDENPEQGTQVLRQWTGASADEIERVYKKWRSDRAGGLA